LHTSSRSSLGFRLAPRAPRILPSSYINIITRCSIARL